MHCLADPRQNLCTTTGGHHLCGRAGESCQRRADPRGSRFVLESKLANLLGQCRLDCLDQPPHDEATPLELLSRQLLATNERNEKLVDGLLTLAETERGLVTSSPLRHAGDRRLQRHRWLSHWNISLGRAGFVRAPRV